MSSYWDIINVVSTACALYPCVQDYHGAVIDNEFTESLVRETPANKSPYDVDMSVLDQALFNDHCLVNHRPVSLDNISSIAYDNQDLNTTYFDGRNVPVPYECFYHFPGAYIRAIQEFLSNTLKGGCSMPGTSYFTTGSEPRKWTTVDCDKAWWLKSLFNDGNATFNTIDANMEAVAVAMTNELRRTGSAWDGTPSYVLGNVSRATVYTRFDWKWLSFPPMA